MSSFFAILFAVFYAVVIVVVLALAWRLVAAVERIADALERRL